MKVMATLAEIRASMATLAQPPKDQDFIRRYLGTPREVRGVKTAYIRQLASRLAKEKGNDTPFMVDILDMLYASPTYEERALAGYLLTQCKTMRTGLPLQRLVPWIGAQTGWAEIDTTCQSLMTASEVSNRWQEFVDLITHLSTSHKIQLRRASLVLLVKPLRESSSPELAELACATVDQLKKEKDSLITKAISWTLRSMVLLHTAHLTSYLKTNSSSLPKIAVREVTRKLATGKK